MQVAERHWHAMGGEAHAIVVARVGANQLLDAAIDRVEQLEESWSRFRPDSDVSRLTRSSGVPVHVSPDTMLALTRAVEAWQATEGRFDPTVGAAMCGLGYDRTFDEVIDNELAARVHQVPGCSAIGLCPADGTVAVPDGVGIDLGGIGKGLAGDIVVAELLDAGADGACVNLGGDLRAAGRPPAGDDWVISVEHPRDHSIEVARVAIVEGAVATSYADGRRWHRGGEVLRHIVDPATGTSVEPRCAVTVIAGEGWWAEVLATSATVEGGTNMTSLVTGLGGEAMSVRADGTIEYSAGFAAFSV